MKFGDKILIDHKLERIIAYDANGKRNKLWKKIVLTKAIEVIVIGQRTLSEGTTEYEYEIGNIYFANKFFKALLVVRDMRTNPFYIYKDQ